MIAAAVGPFRAGVDAALVFALLWQAALTARGIEPGAAPLTLALVAALGAAAGAAIARALPPAGRDEPLTRALAGALCGLAAAVVVAESRLVPPDAAALVWAHGLAGGAFGGAKAGGSR